MYSATSGVFPPSSTPTGPAPNACSSSSAIACAASSSLVGRAPKLSICAVSARCDALSARFAITDTAYVCDAHTMYRPGSAITSTPSAAGKWNSTASETVCATSRKENSPSSVPGKPPPQSRIEGAKPYVRARLKASLAEDTASAKGLRSPQPDPTWKEKPTRLSERSAHVRRSASHSASGAPNLELKRHTDLESSTAMRMMTRASGNTVEILCSSSTLSAVIMRTPCVRE
mmetsp:Transcript_6398/g.14996  ORF Transcript_6398/g.14996 Transcript_6398/m.14996 type:complete len:231 (+) Transcript_6398:96-788(+)